MRPATFAPLVFLALSLPSLQLGGDDGASAQGRAKPREEQAEPREPSRSGDDQRAKPRPPSAPPERQGAPRRPEPPPRVVVVPGPRIYVYPPLSVQRGFYYHPRFLFYYGPYYGPLHQWPRNWGPRLDMSSVRLKVKPRSTQVYLNGYYAGLVDDFDGVFERLYVPSGEHLLELYLDGYRTFRRPVYFGAGDAPDIVHDMQPLRPGEASEPPSRPTALPNGWTSAPPSAGDRPESPFGVFKIELTPADAELRIDDDRWLGSDGRSELVIHLDPGWHRIEVRRPGYRTFMTEINLSAGQHTELRVTLTAEP
jgi:hypothetical protein